MTTRVEVRRLTKDVAWTYQRQIEALTELIGGECVHAEGELLNAEQFQDLRFEISSAAWRGDAMVGVLLACRWTPEQANAEFAYGPGLGSMSGYTYPRTSFHLDHLAVLPEVQGQGIASALMCAWSAATEAVAVRERASRIDWSLETRVETDPSAAQWLYEREGFVVVGRRRYGQHDDHVMWRCREQHTTASASLP